MFSNSLGTTLNMWDNQSSAFKDTFQLLIYDSRGHGKSDAPSGEYSIELLGTDVVLIYLSIKFNNLIWLICPVASRNENWLSSLSCSCCFLAENTKVKLLIWLLGSLAAMIKRSIG